MSKKGTSLRRIELFIHCDRHKRFLQNERKRADVQNIASDFAQGLSYDLLKFSDVFTRYFDFETKFLGKH